MSYPILIGVPFSLLVIFVVVILIERLRGKRFLEGKRSRFDRVSARALYIIDHIDWAAFITHMIKLSLEKIAHDLVHGTLLGIRTIERTLTRAIRTLRERLAHRDSATLTQDGFQLKETLEQFKKSFRRQK